MTRQMVAARARELAAIAGRVPPQPSPGDYEQAQRELAAGPDIDLLEQEEVLESIPESEGWDPVPGSIGWHNSEWLSVEEDSDGRNMSAQLVEEGVKEAEHDQMLQAALAAQRRTEYE